MLGLRLRGEMFKMKNTMRVIDSENQTLFECPIEDQEKAFSYAKQMEELGIEVKIVSPSLPQTLVNSLGMSEENQKIFDESIDHEIDDHEGGCCNKYEQ